MLKTKAHEEHVIAEALRVAVEIYTKDAVNAVQAKQQRIAEQFFTQASAAQDVMDRIDSGDLSLSPEYLSVTGRRMLERQDRERLPITYAARVAQLEADGLSTSDAQATADAEKARGRVFAFDAANPADTIRRSA